VLKGTFMAGNGKKFDADASEPLSSGSFVRMPKEMRHLAWAKTETVIQVHGVGSFKISYVNSADDPRKK
jgi:hypothetical protein